MTTATTTEKPILFSTEMVQAILDGRKTQTRRVIKPQPDNQVNCVNPCKNSEWEFGKDYYNGDGEAIEYKKCPYGKPGDELWVRETFALREACDNKPPSECMEDEAVWYRADNNELTGNAAGKWRPSIHMPREYSRIQLKVEDIRVERVQDISTEEIKAEGVQIPVSQDGSPLIGLGEKYSPAKYLPKGALSKENRGNVTEDDLYEIHWASLWDSINADRGYSWESNPWVWVIEFSIKNIKG